MPAVRPAAPPQRTECAVPAPIGWRRLSPCAAASPAEGRGTRAAASGGSFIECVAEKKEKCTTAGQFCGRPCLLAYRHCRRSELGCDATALFSYAAPWARCRASTVSVLKPRLPASFVAAECRGGGDTLPRCCSLCLTPPLLRPLFIWPPPRRDGTSLTSSACEATCPPRSRSR